MTGTIDPRGILYPARLPEFARFPAPPPLADRVSWFWIARWRVAPGRTSRQQLLPFPALNLVVQPEGVTLAGPSAGAAHRDLTGTGWVVAALLRPAATPALGLAPQAICDQEVKFAATGLYQRVGEPMAQHPHERANQDAVQAFSRWAEEQIPPADAQGLLANQLLDVIAQDCGIVSVEQLAKALSISARSLQRLAAQYVGVAPLAIIRRYRLQEAAQRLRAEPQTRIGQIAAELEYADQAHLAADFRKVFGFSPSAYRRGADH